MLGRYDRCPAMMRRGPPMAICPKKGWWCKGEAGPARGGTSALAGQVRSLGETEEPGSQQGRQSIGQQKMVPAGCRRRALCLRLLSKGNYAVFYGVPEGVRRSRRAMMSTEGVRGRYACEKLTIVSRC